MKTILVFVALIGFLWSSLAGANPFCISCDIKLAGQPVEVAPPQGPITPIDPCTVTKCGADASAQQCQPIEGEVLENLVYPDWGKTPAAPVGPPTEVAPPMRYAPGPMPIEVPCCPKNPMYDF
ncbi:MAG: hypothetical protein HYT22_00215 [Candidatus Niyogibacteria bacterium]|nr:hypothetical protein [Candidatus Niyogibacteria bacterium]